MSHSTEAPSSSSVFSGLPSTDQVALLGSTQEPDPIAAVAALKATIQLEPYRSLVNTYDLAFGKRIGGGYYSDVFKAKLGRKADKKAIKNFHWKLTVIVKIIDAGRCPKKSNYDNELAICKMIQNDPHPHLAEILHLAEFPAQFWLFMAHSGRHLAAFLAKVTHPAGRLPEFIGCDMFKQIASALEYLHKRNVVHRDIKPENILVSKFPKVFTVKLIDYGFAKIVADRTDTGPALCTSHKGTLEFMAPELLAPIYFYDAIKSDIYSLGNLLYYMLHGVSPFVVPSSPETRSLRIIIEMYHELKLGAIAYPGLLHRDHNRLKPVSAEVQQLINMMLAPKPEDRATLVQVLAHNWLQTPAGCQNCKQCGQMTQSPEYPSTESF